MRTKLLTSVCALALLAGGGAALAAGTIPVAIYNFDNPNDLNSFQKLAGGDKCLKKLRPAGSLGINVGDTSPACVFRTSVVADSGDTSPSVSIQADASFEAKTPVKAQSKLAYSLLARASTTGNYELRVSPAKQKWTVLRDPEGSAPAAPLASGTLKAIRPKATKPTKLLLQAFASGSSVALLAQVNGRNVYNAADNAPDPPKGRFNGVAVGNKTGASGLGMQGTFDNVTVSIPRNF